MPRPLGPTALPVAPPSPPVAQGTPVVGILRGSPFTPMPGVPAGAAIGGAPSHAAHFSGATPPPSTGGAVYGGVPGEVLEAGVPYAAGGPPAPFGVGPAAVGVSPSPAGLPAQTPSPGSNLPKSSLTLRQVWHNFPGGFGVVPPPAMTPALAAAGFMSPAAYHTPVPAPRSEGAVRLSLFPAAAATAGDAVTAAGQGEAVDRSLELALEGDGSLPLPASAGAAGGRIPKHRTSRYRGVSRHRLTKRWEASCWVNKKQLYLGGFDQEQKAARAYDIAALLFKGSDTPTNYARAMYAMHLPALRSCSQEELIAHIRRHSSAFSRGKSRYRGVSGHHGRWEARIGTYYNRKNVSFGVYDTEEDAARQYDRALIIQRGRGAKTNFDVSAYDQEVAQYSREKRGRGASYEEALRQTIIACQRAEDAKRKARSEEAEPEPAKPAVRQCTRRALPT